MGKYLKRKDNTAVEYISEDIEVPDYAVEITEQEYYSFINKLPKKTQPDWKTQFQNATTTAEKITVIARRLDLL
jgi:hypothetical protein